LARAGGFHDTQQYAVPRARLVVVTVLAGCRSKSPTLPGDFANRTIDRVVEGAADTLVDPHILQFAYGVSQREVVERRSIGFGFHGKNGLDVFDDPSIPMVRIDKYERGGFRAHSLFDESGQISAIVQDVIITGYGANGNLGDFEIFRADVDDVHRLAQAAAQMRQLGGEPSSIAAHLNDCAAHVGLSVDEFQDIVLCPNRLDFVGATQSVWLEHDRRTPARTEMR